MLTEPANDDGLPIECGTCGNAGELAVVDGALRPSGGFEMVDGSPMCSCGGYAGLRGLRSEGLARR